MLASVEKDYTRCPGWNRRLLDRLRKHQACGRVFVYGPGLLNTPLNWRDDSVFSRVFHSWSDQVLVYLRSFEGVITDDLLYLIELGPRYFHYDITEYARGSLIASCQPEDMEVFDKRSLVYSGLLRLYVRKRRSELELCGTNQSIIPLDNGKLLSIGFGHPEISKMEITETIEPPSYIDRDVIDVLVKVNARIYMLRITSEGVESASIDVEAYHVDPEYVFSREEPIPHILLNEWYPEERRTRLILAPLYTFTQEYSEALLLGDTLLLSTSLEAPSESVEEFSIRTLRKTYKKIAKHVERASGIRPEGGILGLVEKFKEVVNVEEDKLVLKYPCPECMDRGLGAPAWIGLEQAIPALSSGSFILL